MPYSQSNLSNLKQLTAVALSTNYDSTAEDVTTTEANGTNIQSLDTWIQVFLSSPSEINYDKMKAAIDCVFVDQNVGSSLAAGLRYLLTTSDGRVAYDSGVRSDTLLNDKNKWSNYKDNPTNIAENHSSRPEIMQSLLSSSGIGITTRYSSTSTSLTYYLATRLGPGPVSPEGVFRLSLNI